MTAEPFVFPPRIALKDADRTRTDLIEWIERQAGTSETPAKIKLCDSGDYTAVQLAAAARLTALEKGIDLVVLDDAGETVDLASLPVKE